MGWRRLVDFLNCWVSCPKESYKNRVLFPEAPRGFGGSKNCCHRTGAAAVRECTMYKLVPKDSNR